MRRGRLERERHVLIALLDDENGACEVAGVFLFRVGQLVDARVNEEDISQLVYLTLRHIGKLIDVSVKTDVPTMLGPVGVGRDVEDARGLRIEIAVLDAQA